MGNMFSVKRACEHVGLSAAATSDKDTILRSRAVILPGVGAFGEAMNNLAQLDLIDVIKEFVESGRPFMGICLGMQLLFSESEEFGPNKGLGIVEGNVVRFPSKDGDGCVVKIPQICWNQIARSPHSVRTWQASPLTGIREGEFMYFVHSYFAAPKDPNDVLSITNYGGVDYCSSLLKDNVFAVQFHPEKSAIAGIQIYRNWANIVLTYNKQGSHI
jgi:imidazole glycerol phosphate synthase, glutamine amidotransferase subunit